MHSASVGWENQYLNVEQDYGLNKAIDTLGSTVVQRMCNLPDNET